MTEWWTYRPVDFLMFAPRAYWRLFELHNLAWWPLQPLLVGIGLVGLWALARGRPAAPRAVAAGLAVAWAFVAAAFLLPRYAPINWAATGLAAGFFVQAGGLALLAARRDLSLAPHGRPRAAGLVLIAWALLAHPLLAAAFARRWTQAEIFALAPDPTAIATLGFVLCVRTTGRIGARLQRLVAALALLACAVSAATLWTMGSAQGWVLAAACLVVPALRIADNGSHRATP